MTYLHHLTLTTGDLRRSYRAEVDDLAVAACRELIARATSDSTRLHPMPAPPGYELRATREGRALLCTVFAAGGAPLVTFGVAATARAGAGLWRVLVASAPVADGVQRPAPPWVAAIVHPTAALDTDAMAWIGDFERCVGWAFVERRALGHS